jgi:hypothetical protein
MNPDDLDRIFLTEKRIEASPSFMREAMMRVRTEASYRRRVPFPWIPYTAVTLVLALAAIWVFPVDSVLRATYWLSYTMGNWIISPPEMGFGKVILPALASLLGTFLLAWISLRLVDTGS